MGNGLRLKREVKSESATSFAQRKQSVVAPPPSPAEKVRLWRTGGGDSRVESSLLKVRLNDNLIVGTFELLARVNHRRQGVPFRVDSRWFRHLDRLLLDLLLLPLVQHVLLVLRDPFARFNVSAHAERFGVVGAPHAVATSGSVAIT